MPAVATPNVVGANRPIVPNRPVAPPVGGKAQIPAGAQPQRPVAPQVAPQAPQVAPQAPQVAPQAPQNVAANGNTPEAAGDTAAAATPKKRGPRKGTGAGRKASNLVAYPGLFFHDESGNPVMVDSGAQDAQGQPVFIHQRGKLEVAPGADYDVTKHVKLKPSDFTDESVYLEWRADTLEASAKRLRGRAAQLRKLGNIEDRARANKLLKMRENMAKLQAQLEAQGIDMNELAAISATDAE